MDKPTPTASFRLPTVTLGTPVAGESQPNVDLEGTASPGTPTPATPRKSLVSSATLSQFPPLQELDIHEDYYHKAKAWYDKHGSTLNPEDRHIFLSNIPHLKFLQSTRSIIRHRIGRNARTNPSWGYLPLLHFLWDWPTIKNSVIIESMQVRYPNADLSKTVQNDDMARFAPVDPQSDDEDTLLAHDHEPAQTDEDLPMGTSDLAGSDLDDANSENELQNLPLQKSVAVLKHGARTPAKTPEVESTVSSPRTLMQNFRLANTDKTRSSPNHDLLERPRKKAKTAPSDADWFERRLSQIGTNPAPRGGSELLQDEDAALARQEIAALQNHITESHEESLSQQLDNLEQLQHSRKLCAELKQAFEIELSEMKKRVDSGFEALKESADSEMGKIEDQIEQSVQRATNAARRDHRRKLAIEDKVQRMAQR